MVSYRKLREIKVERKLQWQQIQHGAKVSPTTIAKINKDEYITLINLEKICRYLKVGIGDVVELKD